jgi:lipoate-protein ligase A
MVPLDNKTWRLILSPPEGGATNMAIDEAILLAAGRGEVPPTLRLYSWAPPCLSLGYAQPSSDVDYPQLEARGWEIVRRPTGGRAILHTDELTYAVIGQDSNPILAGGVLESYQRISQALLSALHHLNIPAQANPQKLNESGDQSQEPICFEVPSNYEIIFQGRKLIGSAQARKRSAVLQHGSLPLYGDLARISLALNYDTDAARDEAANRLLGRATTVEAVLGHRISWDSAAQAFANAFERKLDLELVPGELTLDEHQTVEKLVAEKYAHPTWTNRV